ncbi:outer membrane beta-barrel protein [Maribacter arenosus]|uniref:Outer membrane beta-barrel protein n=1 Tax=Maribacter arenosus TaxID=1854708 RepID=A0ABR7VIR9_9FLAO|nr:outer membrane beta-barrel protein [Maribacter arenosus]MBD0851954.1 outer membrane beta-barrel protein [Maribacter arenosus]
MKKTLLIILILIPLLGSSQKRLGAFTGLNNSSISEGFLKESYFTDKLGFHIGGFYEMDLSEKVKFRPKLVYSQQGNRGEYDHIIGEKLDYLNIPLNLKFYERTYLMVGPQIGFLVSKKNTFFFQSVKQSFDAGLNLGLGQRIHDFFIEINLYQGFTKAIESRDFIKGTNTVIQLSAGVYIF